MGSRLGLEGVVTFKKPIEFDAQNYAVTLPGPAGEAGVRVAVFDRVAVHVEVEKDRNTQRGRVKMSLAEPVDSRGM
jgi:exosome complex exonuclease DIS3/RRP44